MTAPMMVNPAPVLAEYDRHPHADPDGILRDGSCRANFFRAKVVMKDHDGVARIMADQYNRLFFYGRLPMSSLRVRVVHHPDHFGSFSLGSRIIQIDPEAMESYEVFRDTMLHEMCHAYQRLVEFDTTGAAHSPAWLAQAQALGVYISEEQAREAEEAAAPAAPPPPPPRRSLAATLARIAAEVASLLAFGVSMAIASCVPRARRPRPPRP